MSTSVSLLGKQIALTIERMAYGGDGLGHYEGKVVFVPYSAPGDQLTVEIIEDHLRYARGKVVTLNTSSTERTEPRCPVFRECGGCHWQHLNYEAQARYKEEIFRETIAHLGGLRDPVVETIVAAEQPWEYRERIRLKVDRKGKAGFYAQDSHQVVPFEYCHISHPRLNDALQKGGRLRENCELVYDRQNDQVTTRLDESAYRNFAQAHPAQNLELVQTVLEYAESESHQRVLELYCGTGNLGLALAPRVASLLAVDRDPKAIKEAEHLARAMNVPHVTFITGTAEWGLKTMLRQRKWPDTLILDPPREGAKEILDLIVVLSAHKIVYVSCDPSSLARDLKFLTKKGYRMVKARPIDMFPQTYHIEAVVQLIHT